VSVELIQAIKVKIEQIDKTATPFSGGVAGRREHMGNIQRKIEITLKAQVVFRDVSIDLNFSQLGASEKTKGYLVLRMKDLKPKGVTLARGDKIIKIGQLDVEYFLIHTTGDPAAHFIGKDFTLVRMFFADRDPKGNK